MRAKFKYRLEKKVPSLLVYKKSRILEPKSLLFTKKWELKNIMNMNTKIKRQLTLFREHNDSPMCSPQLKWNEIYKNNLKPFLIDIHTDKT